MSGTCTFTITPPEDALLRFRGAGNASPFALCIETQFVIGLDESVCGGHMVLLPGLGALESIVSSLNLSM